MIVNPVGHTARRLCKTQSLGVVRNGSRGAAAAADRPVGSESERENALRRDEKKKREERNGEFPAGKKLIYVCIARAVYYIEWDTLFVPHCTSISAIRGRLHLHLLFLSIYILSRVYLYIQEVLYTYMPYRDDDDDDASFLERTVLNPIN